MHCIRRAALRAACSSSRFIAVPRQQVSAIGMHIGKVNTHPTSALPLPRYFSQTTPVAAENESSNPAETSSENAAPDANTTLRSGPTESEITEKNSAGIFIHNLTFDATEAHLKEAFGKYGDIVETRIARDGRGLSRGFGFVTFTNAQSATQAINETHNSFWHGRRINVHPRTNGPAKTQNRPSFDGPTNSLYIGNIPYEASDADLNQLFRTLDNVTDVRVAVDRNTGWPRGFAHADFADVESAQKAYEILQQATLSGRSLRIDYAASSRSRRQ